MKLQELTFEEGDRALINASKVIDYSDGAKKEPYTEEDTPNQIKVYGIKLKGEKYISNQLEKYSIVRTSWVNCEYENNIFKSLFRLAKYFDRMNVVNDQFASLTNAKDLAKVIM
jgi:dTDP-4-dehydrorhamnose reductase